MATDSRRRKTSYFNVPASQQPMRIRPEQERKSREPATGYINPLEQLIVVPERRPFHYDPFDAAYEDADGRLPHDPGSFTPEPDTFVVAEIPEWVLADALELHAEGASLRKIATAILPVTDCADIPSCEEILRIRLTLPAAPPIN